MAPEVVPLRQEAAKTRGLGCFVPFFKEQGERCLGKELEEKMEGGLSVGALTRVVCKVRLGSPGVLLSIWDPLLLLQVFGAGKGQGSGCWVPSWGPPTRCFAAS